MGKPLITLAVMMLSLACGPEAGEEDDIPGKLEYEQRDERLYRLDRRIDVITRIPGEEDEHRECGLLTDRAYDDLERTLGRLDASVDYGEHPADCTPNEALVHVDGFEGSPFECSLDCCHRGLAWAALVYHMILESFDGNVTGIEIANELDPYVAIEPDQPCP